MKNYSFILIIVVLSWIMQLFFPWWIIAVVCFVVCYVFKTSGFTGFSGSLLAVFVLWFLGAYLNDSHFDQPMSHILGSLFGNVSSSAVFFLTGITGGLVGGLSGWLGSRTRTLSSNH